MSASWTTELLGNVATLQRGFDLPHRLRKSGIVPIVTSSGIGGSHSEAKVEAPGVVTGRYGTIGEVFFVRNDFWPLNTTLYVRDFHENSPLFISYLLRTIDFHTHSGKSGVPGVNRNDLHKISVHVPPTKAEQEAIAEALSDADALIESLQQLLVKKRQIKQGTMQELLTGKKRLPGFSDEWEERALLDLAADMKERFDDGDWVESKHITDGGIRLLQTGNIGIGAFVEKDDKKYITEKSFVSLRCKEIRQGDLLICRLADPAGRSCVLPDIGESKIIASVDVTIFRPPASVANRVFLENIFSTDQWFRAVSERSGGTTHKRISRGALGRLKIKLPSIDEQDAIATMLFDVDSEIATIEAKLTKIRDIKQGMVQELLTGRIRLVKPRASVAEVEPTSKKTKPHNWQFNEAVVISALTKRFGTEQRPLARVRRTKLSYLLHRHVGEQTEGYLKKAAGPYDPRVRYGGPEKIALKNGYVCEHNNGNYRGFVAADNIAKAEDYFGARYGSDDGRWLEQFRRKKTKELELLATVDMAMVDLLRDGIEIELTTVKQLIHDDPEWKSKLDREVFSDQNIVRAIQECQRLFGHSSPQ